MPAGFAPADKPAPHVEFDAARGIFMPDSLTLPLENPKLFIENPSKPIENHPKSTES